MKNIYNQKNINSYPATVIKTSQDGIFVVNKTGEELLESEIRFRTLVEHLPTIIYIAALDEFSTTLYVSPQIEKILGISPEEYIANPDLWLKHLHNEDRERVLEELKYSHETNQPSISEYRMITKKGKIVWLRDEAMIVKNEKGNPLYLQGIMLDITGHKQAEKRIEHLNGVLKAIRNVNQLIVVEKDKDRMIQKACDALIDARDYNAAWLGLLQDDKSFTAVVGSGSGEYISRFCENTVTGNYSPCIKNALVQDNNFLIIDKTTECGDCFIKNSCIGNEAAIIRIEYDGRLLGLLTISLIAGVHVDDEEKELLKEVAGDIAFALHNMEEEKARKQAEEALQESEERLRIKLDYILSPDKKVKNISLTDLVDLKNLQQIQDAFAVANDVASIISDVDGKPITKASNFCGVCEIIRTTKKGNKNCNKSDKILGEKAKVLMKPTYEKCLSCGFVDASAPIIVGGKHIANWLIGQSNVMDVGKERIGTYAKEIGADTKKMLDAFELMPQMTLEKFEQVLDLLWYFAKELSTLGYNNLKLAKNITEIKQTEEELQKKEKQLRQIIDTVPHMIFAKDRDGRFIMANKTIADGCGTTPENMIGKTHPELLGATPDQYEAYLNDDRKVIDSGKLKFIPEEDYTHPDGHKAILETTKIPFTSAGIPAVLGVSVDITERKQAEEALKESEEKLRNIFEHSTNAFYSHTPEHILTYISPQVEEIIGYKADEALKKWTEFTSDNPENKIGFELTEKAIRTGKQQPPYELEFIHKNGKKVWIEVHESPVVVNRKTIAIVGAFTDITERKNAEQELKKYRKHLEELVKERTKELEEKNRELEHMNSLFVGREFRIKELRDKIKEMEKKYE